MPYVSQAQAGYFHTHKKQLEAQGVNVDEWDAASRGKSLPKRKTPKNVFSNRRSALVKRG